MNIHWTSAGDPDQDEALADEISDFAMTLLADLDPAIDATLVDPEAAP